MMRKYKLICVKTQNTKSREVQVTYVGAEKLVKITLH